MNTLSFGSLERGTQIPQGESLLCKLDSQGVVSYVSDSFLLFNEYNVEDVIGKSALDFRHPEFPITVFNHVMQYLFQKKIFIYSEKVKQLRVKIIGLLPIFTLKRIPKENC